MPMKIRFFNYQLKMLSYLGKSIGQGLKLYRKNDLIIN